MSRQVIRLPQPDLVCSQLYARAETRTVPHGEAQRVPDSRLCKQSSDAIYDGRPHSGMQVELVPQVHGEPAVQHDDNQGIRSRRSLRQRFSQLHCHLLYPQL